MDRLKARLGENIGERDANMPQSQTRPESKKGSP